MTDYTKSFAIRGSLARNGVITIRMTQAEADRLGFSNGAKVARGFLTEHADLHLELVPSMFTGVQGRNPDGTSEGLAKIWQFGCNKWFPNTVAEVDRFAMQNLAVHVTQKKGEPTRILIDLNQVEFGGEDAQEELPLEDKPVLLLEATRRQLVERLLELEDE